MSVTVTLAPCAPSRQTRRSIPGKSPLLELAQAMSDDSDGLPIRVLDEAGNLAAVIGGAVDDVELF